MNEQQLEIVNHFKTTLYDRKQEMYNECYRLYSIHPYDDLTLMRGVLLNLVKAYATFKGYLLSESELVACRDEIYNIIIGV